MPRELSAPVLAQIEGSQQRYCHLFYGDWGAGGVIRLTDAAFNISHGGFTYLAVGGLLSFDPVEENPSLKVNELNVALTGQLPEILALIDNYSLIGIPVFVWRAYLDANGQVVGDPVVIFSGNTDGAELSEELDSASVGLKCRDDLSNFDKVRGRRTNDKEHRTKYPNDPCFEFVAPLVEKVIQWKTR